MSVKDQWDLLAALPFVAGLGGLLYIAIVAFGGSALGLKRRRRERDREAKRQAPGNTPWSQWLDEINDRAARDPLDDASEKWRE